MSELLKLENQLCHRFYTLSNAFTRAYRPLLKALDITYPQYVTLMALWETDHITIAELLDRTAIDGGAMSGANVVQTQRYECRRKPRIG